MRRLRTPALAAVLAFLSLGASPASAVPLYWVFTGTAQVDCFGCGAPSPCHADLFIHGVTHTGSAVTTACMALEPTGTLCLATGSAQGTVRGTSGTATGVTLHFAWTRVGAVAVITVTGAANGTGQATFVTSGVSCGAPLQNATIAGWVGGI